MRRVAVTDVALKTWWHSFFVYFLLLPVRLLLLYRTRCPLAQSQATGSAPSSGAVEAPHISKDPKWDGPLHPRWKSL